MEESVLDEIILLYLEVLFWIWDLYFLNEDWEGEDVIAQP